MKVVLIIFIFFLPLADEILSYPAYHKLCENGGKYQFAPGMDERKVFGRYYRTKVVEEKLIRLFPDFQTIPASEANSYGVVILATKIHLIDDKSNEVLLVSEGFKPIRSAFAISWDGSRITWLLHECSNLVGSNGAASSLDGACGIQVFVASMSRILLHFIRATLLLNLVPGKALTHQD